MAESQTNEPSVSDGIKAGLFGTSGYSGTSTAVLRTIIREHVAKRDLDRVVKGFEDTGATVVTASDGPDTYKLVVTWDN